MPQSFIEQSRIINSFSRSIIDFYTLISITISSKSSYISSILPYSQNLIILIGSAFFFSKLKLCPSINSLADAQQVYLHFRYQQYIFKYYRRISASKDNSYITFYFYFKQSISITLLNIGIINQLKIRKKIFSRAYIIASTTIQYLYNLITSRRFFSTFYIINLNNSTICNGLNALQQSSLIESQQTRLIDAQITLD